MLPKERSARRPLKFSDIAFGAIPIPLFVAIISISVPSTLSRALSAYSLPLFVVVLVLFYFGFRLPAQYRWAASSCLTMLLLGLTLSFLWTSGYSDDKIIGGLLPFRDGFDYYNGANWILSGQAIKILNEGAAWRPLYPGFLSALLFITGRNLQAALAIQVGLAGICLSLSANHLRSKLGAVAAAAYVTLLYFYIQPLLGTAYTETLGLTVGCLAFVLLWQSAETRQLRYLVVGLAGLMLAISARAGTFFIFPALVAWAGMFWRAPARFSLSPAAIALAAVVSAYLIFNGVFSRLIVEPGGSPFGNFAFTIYGQVAGGAGYHKAFEDLGVRNPAVILRAAARFFLAHPAGFAVGAAKAYRDFFSPQSGIFSFGLEWQDLAVWLAGTGLLLSGAVRTIKQAAASGESLLLAGFAGILLSIPFLPPIDGGIRIYASTMPFVYALPALGLAGLIPRPDEPGTQTLILRPATLGVFVCVFLSVVVPLVIRYGSPPPPNFAGSCPQGQVPYETVVSKGSYVDLLPEGSGACGIMPAVCLRDFQSYGKSNDPSDAEVYSELISSAGGSGLRVFAGNDFVNGRPHLFVGEPERLNTPGNAVFGGCAQETLIKGRPSIYGIQSVNDVILFPAR